MRDEKGESVYVYVGFSQNENGALLPRESARARRQRIDTRAYRGVVRVPFIIAVPWSPPNSRPQKETLILGFLINDCFPTE